MNEHCGKDGRYVIKKKFRGVVRRREKSFDVLGEWENVSSIDREVRREQSVWRDEWRHWGDIDETAIKLLEKASRPLERSLGDKFRIEGEPHIVDSNSCS